MATTLETVQKLEQRRTELKVKRGEAGDLRPGSLVERYRRCGKAGCHCAGEGSDGHGPSWSLTREVGGKTITRVIPPDAVARTRAQIDEYRRFRAVVRELGDTSEPALRRQVGGPRAFAHRVVELRAVLRKMSRRPSLS